MQNPLSIAILRSLIYFDIFQYPLTLDELALYRERTVNDQYSRQDILGEYCSNTWLQERVSFKQGFFFLKEKESIITLRKLRYDYSISKIRKATFFSYIFMCVPFVRAVGVCNDVAIYNAHEQSDIDFIIIAKKGWIWWVRLVCAGVTSLLGQRPDQKVRRRNTICLSFYIEEGAHAALCDAALKTNEDCADIHYYYWAAQWYFLLAHNSMVQVPVFADEVHSAHLREKMLDVSHFPVLLKYCKVLLEVCMSLFRPVVNYWARRIQMTILPTRLQHGLTQATHVVMTDSLLKLHVSDSRETVRNQWVSALKSYGV